MSRIPRLDDLGSILRDFRIRLERLERGKAIVGGSGGGGLVNSVNSSGPGLLVSPVVGDVVVQNTGVTSATGAFDASVSPTTGAVVVTVKAAPGSWSPLTDGNPSFPELVFDAGGDVIWVPIA